MASDRAYFENYPERTNWCRPITRAEVTELLTFLPPLADGETLGGVVVVTALVPGVRHKKYHPHVIPRGSA